MKTLYLHIGIEKTGSTSIQNALAANRHILHAEGIDYPGCFRYSNHVELACISQNYDSNSELYSVVGFFGDEAAVADHSARFRSRFANYVENSVCERFVLSNEHLHSRVRSPREIKRLADFLYQFFEKITVVVYFREQLELAVSHYSTKIKSGGTEDFCLPDLSLGIPYYYDFGLIIKNWSVFDEVVIREFDRKKLKGGDVVADFCSVISHKPLAIKGADGANESLGVSSLELLKMINAHLPLLKNGKMNPQRFRLVSFLERIADRGGIQVNPQEARQFRGIFRPLNLELASQYGLDSSFLEKESKTGDAIETDIGKAMSDLWLIVSDHINFVEMNNVRLKAKIAYLESGEDAAVQILENANRSGYQLNVVKVMENIKAGNI